MKDDNNTKLERDITIILKSQPKIISDWNDMLEISGSTVATRKRYIYVISEFLDYLKRYEHIKISNIKTQNILHFS